MLDLEKKTYSYVGDDGSEDKKAKDTKKHIKCIKFEDNKSCLEATQIENKINYTEKNKINIDSLKTNNNQFIRNDK